ncbi:MAG: hypothetical protein H7A37_04205 [Chlamydiales bacterium]|nr:hypothetical protein [Chlamydiia bacterium]MCP5507489.1 hypothetical protein [Chlamydiales bacterium]
MKYISIIIASMLLVLSSCSMGDRQAGEPVLTHVNIVDQNGLSETISNEDRLKQYRRVDFTQPQPYQKVIRVYSRDVNGNIRAVITSYHPNGQIKQYLDVLNNTANGNFREWYQNGNLKVDAYVVNGIADLNTAAEQSWQFDGCSRAWDEEGNLVAAIPYDKGELQGDSLYYHPNGELWKRVPFVRGEMHGTMEIYLDSGELLATVQYVNNVRHGKANRYWCDGAIAADEHFDHGLLTGATYYDQTERRIAAIKDGYGQRAVFGKDTLVELQEFRSGIQEGQVQAFSESGDLVSSYHIANGVKHGEEVEYYPKRRDEVKAKPCLLVNWYEGCIQGIVKTWYPNGNQESQREMSENKKNGMLTAWYENGSLMMIEEYDQDILQKGKYFKNGEKRPVSQVKEGMGTATFFDPKGSFLRRVEYKNGVPLE